MSELVKALVKARMACKPTVHKSAKNSAQGYSYVGHEQVLVSGARESLLAHGLVLVEKAVTFAGCLEYKTKNGEQQCWRWRGVFELVHESGESREYEFEATTGANDKAAFVASTALDRTAHLRICCIAGSAEEDPEHDSHDRFAEAAAKSQRTKRTLDDVARGVDPAQAAAAARSEEIAANYNKMAQFSNDAMTGELDSFGLMVPTGDPPRFQSGKDEGKSYGEVPAGKIRALMGSDAFREKASAHTQIWAAYIVATHELSKLKEQDNGAPAT
jgi:hypothetical protein